jgi:hypothetical protein
MDYNSGCFNSKVYLNQYYETVEGHPDEKLNYFFIENLTKLFDREELRLGGLLIDVGTGPSMQTTVLASKHFDRIVLTDYCESNRIDIIKWLCEMPGSHDWSHTIEHVAKIERPEKTPGEIEQKARKSVLGCLEIDVNRRNPNWLAKFDAMLSSLCLEAACVDISSYYNAICNLNGLLKKGGLFIMMGV